MSTIPYKLYIQLSKCCNIEFFDACSANAASDEKIMGHVEESSLVIFLTSTQGNGDIPSLAEKFFSLLFNTNGHLLKKKETAVLGFGSSAYPIFCGGAAKISEKLDQVGAIELIPLGKCDAVKGESKSFSK